MTAESGTSAAKSGFDETRVNIGWIDGELKAIRERSVMLV